MSEDSSAVKISIWDKENQKWTDDDIRGDIDFNKQKKELKFQTTRYAPMALLQSRCTDYPYKDWWLRCVSEDKAILTIWTKRLKMTFEITPLCLSLTHTNLETPELDHLKNRVLAPGYLLAELSNSGIHLMPRDEDAQLGGLEMKARPAEERAILDVACTVDAFHYRRCKWNQGESAENSGVGMDTIVVRIRENLEYDESFAEDYEPDWKQVMWWSNKVSFVEGTKETDSKCTVRIAENQVTHSILRQTLVPEMCSAKALERCSSVSNIEFIDTVKKTLRLTRLLAFS
jgi:cancer susceptibility candidate protein 1